MPENKEQNIWVKRLVAGDEIAYKFFFQEYYPVFVHFAQKYVKDIYSAEDIVHDVILELYSSKRHFDNLEKLKTFLYHSVKNRAINHIRHENAKLHYIQESMFRENEEFFLDAIIEEEVYFLMNKALKDFPNQIQNVYELALQGKSNEEIARSLNLSLDSVKSYKKRGKQILKEKLKGLLYFLSVSL